MSVTTVAAIRDRMITVIRQMAPAVFSSDPFVPFANEEGADFEPWAEANSDGATRMFQVRQVGDVDPPETSDATTEQLLARFRVTVAYPNSNRWGSDEGLDRDDVIESDRNKIERVIGLYGKANFTAPYPDACWRPDPRPSRTVIRADACDFLVIEQSMSYWRATDGFVLATPNNIVTLANAAGADVPICTPVYSAGAGAFSLAKADAVGTATVIGLTAAPIISGASGPVQVADVITATAAQWDAVCGTSGGLTYNTTYYLSAATAGKLTATAPSTVTQFVTVCIQALSTTQATVAIEPTVLL